MSMRSSSPSEASASEKYRSPRSRPRTLLGGTDSDSEDAPLSPPPGSAEDLQINADMESSEDEIVRPRGRFAARMLGSPQAVPEAPAPPKAAPGAVTESARDRVRRLLGMDASASPREETQEQMKVTAEGDSVNASEDEDEDLSSTPHRRRRTERQPTPDLEPEGPPSSPGLFVSPCQKSAAGDDAEDDIALPKPKNPRFQALVDRKRREREAKVAEEEAKRAARSANYDDDDSSGVTDDDAGRKMTQEGRTKRKAGKKAIEEMNRETQRMARSMQLAHQAMTKKKVTKATLFEKFGFKQPGAATEAKLGSSSRPTTPASDAEMKDAGTPPSSPPSSPPPRSAEKAVQDAVMNEELPEDDFLPADQSPPSSPRAPREDKGKGVATERSTTTTEAKPSEAKPKPRMRVKLPPPTANLITIDSDDELAITTKNSKLDALFDRVPEKKKKPGAFQAFKCLAQVTSPGKTPHGKNERPGMTGAEMQMMLRARAREQARIEKEKRIEMLKAKGVVIQTEEERRKEMEEVEDIVARAREEAEEIMQREKVEAKRAKKEQDGEADPLGWDDSEDDGDYQASGEEEDDADDEDEREIELSGTEDEDEEGKSEDEPPNPLFENEADDDGPEGSDAENDAETAAADEPKATQVDDDEESILLPRARRTKNTRVLSDDEDERDDIVKATPKPKSTLYKSPVTDSPVAPTSVLRSATKTFIPGLPVAPANPAGLGLTQMFAGTMADSQMGTPTQSMNSPMPTFDPFARPTMDSQDMNEDDVVMDSQPQQETLGATQGVDLHYSQTQMRGLDSLLREESTQLSDIQLTQDQGLEEHTPMRERFIDAPMSTVSMVPASGSTQTVHETPLARKGRLRRKMDVIPATPAEEAHKDSRESPERDEFGFNTTVLGVMKKAAKEERAKKQELNRKKTKAAEMIEEQAEESEDEYAGLGGVDEDDASDGDLESVRDLIDDEKKGNTAEEERNLAAFYADRERADAERDVERLFKDITTGALRRKRANDYDLSDSDDGGEARKRRKRMQFAKMQKALFADERVKKMSENPGNQAFLRTLEDQASGDEMDLIDIVEDAESEESQSQSQSQSQAQGQEKDGVLVPNSQPATTDRAPAHTRRTKNGKKPSNIGDIRESLSSLLDEPGGSTVAPTEFDSESENEGRDKENVSPPRRGVVRDRISLKRGSTSESSNGARRAFAGASQGFKAPTLLRRATSSSLMSNLTASSSRDSKADSMFGEKIKKAAGRGSGVVAGEKRGVAPRESSGEAKRRERRMKGAEERLKAARGLFGGVAFE